MSEEKLFDVNWDQRKWETPASAQDMKLYSYPPRTIRNMSVPGFLTWLVLLLASIGGLLYTAWMTVTGDYEDGKVNTILGVVSFVVLLCCLIYKTNVLRVVDALCLEKSKYFETEISGIGTVYTVSKYGIYSDKTENSDVFKLGNRQQVPLFVSEKFKILMEEESITGITLTEIAVQ